MSSREHKEFKITKNHPARPRRTASALGASSRLNTHAGHPAPELGHQKRAGDPTSAGLVDQEIPLGDTRQADQRHDFQPGKASSRVDELSADGDELNAALRQSFGQKIMSSRPMTALLKETDDKLPYPELFDRSERTFAATFAKFGDLSYFTPIQRIGVYMDYS